MTTSDAAPAIRSVAQLRALFVRLPHVPTPAELARLQRFEVIVADPALAGTEDIESIVAGWRRWWREGRVDQIAAMASAISADLVESDPRLLDLAFVARERSRR